MSWNERLDRPIDLPNGKKLLTLEDARLYILQLPRSEIESIPCQIAIEALLIAEAGSFRIRSPGPKSPSLFEPGIIKSQGVAEQKITGTNPSKTDF